VVALAAVVSTPVAVTMDTVLTITIASAEVTPTVADVM
jgi:hypothetical protein